MVTGGRAEELAARVLDRGLERRPGMLVGIVDDDARVIRAGGDLALDALVEIGSVTKLFTATLLALFVEEGVTRLDAPVQGLLPPGITVPSSGGVQITLEHLATHTSGLPRLPSDVGALRGTLEILRGRDPYATFTESDLLAGLARTRLLRTPGKGRPAYSNLGYGLLGVALACKARSTYGPTVTRQVCRPLGLADTVTARTADLTHRARWATGHRGAGRYAQDWPLTGLAGAGAIRSTVSDQLDFLGAQLDPPDSPLGRAIRATRRPTQGGHLMGWQRLEGRGRTLLWHTGGTGGFRSFVGLVPQRRQAVAVFTDSSRGVRSVGLRLLRDLDGRG